MRDVEVFNSVNALQVRLQSEQENTTVGFVPTMGALHDGHLSLVNASMKDCDVTVVSIFVNPTQFNNPSDLEKYPRNFEKDIRLLSTLGKVIVFAPSVEQVYPENYQTIRLNLGSMGLVMEGKFREGHFDGVVNVVKRFFEIIEPTNAYFGEKDFQQLAVVRYMVDHFGMAVKIIGCPIYREETGLAASSRNERLTDQDKKDALVISRILKEAEKNALQLSPREVIQIASESFKTSKLDLEYFQIVDPITLMDLDAWKPGAHACVTAYCGAVRLLDNLQLVPYE